MRRTARALSVAALAGVALGTAAQAATADPAAEVSPGAVAPGGSVTVSVTCDAVGASAPATLEAVSQAFEDGTVELARASGEAAAPVYRGTARISPAENFEGDPDAAGPRSEWTADGACPAAAGGEGKEWSATFTVAPGTGGAALSAGGPGTGTEAAADAALGSGTGGTGSGEDDLGTGTGTGTSTGTGTGTGGGWTGGGRPCAGQPGRTGGAYEPGTGGTGSGWGAGETGGTGSGRDRTEPGGKPQPAESGLAEPAPLPEAGWGGKESGRCDGTRAPGGVQAGAGGTFGDSVPALVAGGLLIAGAAGGAVYRLRRRTPPGDG